VSVLLDANVDVAANEAQAGVAHHCAGKQARFGRAFEIRCRYEDHAAGARDFSTDFITGEKRAMAPVRR